MLNQPKLYDKVNQLRENLLLFIDKEIQNINKTFQQNNRNLFTFEKIKMDDKVIPITEEECFSYGTKENSIINNDSFIQEEKEIKRLSKMKFVSCRLFQVYEKNPISSWKSRSSKRLEIQNENFVNNKDKLIFIFNSKKYEIKNFNHRDKVVCFEEINNNNKVKDKKYYKKYLNNLAKKLKNGKSREN